MNTYNYEIEVKYRVDRFSDIISILDSLGANKYKIVHEKDIYFQHPCRDFQKSDEALRIRIENDKNIFLTYKGKRIDFFPKKRKEITIHIEKLKNIMLILKSLGFKELAVIEKKREYWLLGEWIISLDDVKKLGYFIEIEYRGTEFSKDKLLDLLKKLNIDLNRYEKKSYLELFLEKKCLDLV